jgi:uncharacterized protein with PIN domain
MKQTRAQKETKLRKAADEMIEAFLAWDEENSAPNLTEIEEVILALRRRMGEQMLGVALGGQELRQPVESPLCPECGAKMRNKGQKRRAVESRVGGVELERSHYYCACCQSGLFPPGPATRVGSRAVE